jgi:hypothetical protein
MELILGILVVAVAILTAMLLRYQNKIKHKNTRLIQFYLDKKFINKIILTYLNSDKPQDKFCLELIESIKEYFCLDDIIIINNFGLENTLLGKQIEDFVKDNYSQLKLQQEQSNNMISTTINITQGSFKLYLNRASNSHEPKSLIICALKEPPSLSTDDIHSLESATNLLRSFIQNFIMD